MLKEISCILVCAIFPTKLGMRFSGFCILTSRAFCTTDSSPGSLGTSSACSSDHTTETSKSGKTVLGFDERMLLHYEASQSKQDAIGS